MHNNETNIKQTRSYKINKIKVKSETSNTGFLKTILIMSLLALEFVLFILAYLYIATFIEYYLIISIILTFISCLHVICSDRNSLSKPVWVLFLIITFAFGYIFYFLSDERVFWKNSKKRYNKILTKLNKLKESTPQIPNKNNPIAQIKNYLLASGNFNSYTNTSSTYFEDGSQFIFELIEKIKSAKKFIFLEFFIISDGKLFNKILNILKERAKNNIDVKIICDDLVCHRTLSRKTRKEILSAGIKLKFFNKLLPRVSLFTNFRDHRKIAVIDGEFAFTGGINLADEYINEKKVHGYWKDCGIMLNGPAVNSFTLTFLATWDFLNKTDTDYNKYLSRTNKKENNAIVIPYFDGLEYEANIGKDTYINLISLASEKIYIMSPYLVLDDAIKNLLEIKARSGVDVRIIIPDIADKKLVYIQTRNVAEKLMLKGIKLYTLKNSFVHSKLLLTESAGIVGSINFDLRSFYQQFECAVLITDEKTTSRINEDFINTFKKSNIITKENANRRFLTFRIIAGITSLISPFM